jgi:hypothetical protein
MADSDFFERRLYWRDANEHRNGKRDALREVLKHSA